MSRAVDRARAHRHGKTRHSNMMAAGRGDPRDHRREEQGLTDHSIDERFFAIRDGKLTLEIDQAGLATLLAPLVGAGLVVGQNGLEVNMGASLALDEQGRLAVRFRDIETVTDETEGTASSTLAAIPDPADTPASADALRDDLVANALPAIRDAIASLSAKLNEILSASSVNVRT